MSNVRRPPWVRSRGSISIHILRLLLIRGARREPSVRPGDVTAGHPVNLQQPWDAARWFVLFFFSPPSLRNARIRERRAGKVEVLTERQGHTQSRKPLESEWSSVFPIVQRRRAAQLREDRGRGGAAESRRLQAAARDGAGGEK